MHLQHPHETPNSPSLDELALRFLSPFGWSTPLSLDYCSVVPTIPSGKLLDIAPVSPEPQSEQPTVRPDIRIEIAAAMMDRHFLRRAMISEKRVREVFGISSDTPPEKRHAALLEALKAMDPSCMESRLKSLSKGVLFGRPLQATMALGSGYLALKILQYVSGTPLHDVPILRDHFNDFLTPFFAISWARVLMSSQRSVPGVFMKSAPLVFALAFPILQEVAQGVGLMSGVFDWKDIGAFFLGAIPASAIFRGYDTKRRNALLTLSNLIDRTVGRDSLGSLHLE